MTEDQVDIEIVSARDLPLNLQDLAALLNACVNAGASIHFILPHEMSESVAYWTDLIKPALDAEERVLFVARLDATIVGTVQLDCAMPPNQVHRAEVSKLLVHPDYQRRGIARTLMAALEREARRRNRTLITLDTRTGDKAEPLYRSLGYEAAGVIPGFARDVIEDRYDSTTYMYKALR